MKDTKITVTKPYLPPLEEFIPYLEEIWANRWLTNNGPMHNKLESELTRYLGVPYVSLFANGTLALLTALQSLDIQGEVITTPYSFVATTHAMIWNGLTPVFVDVDPIYATLNPEKIEAAITKETTAIVPVHVYGTPCDVETIAIIAAKHNLKVIYDAAHAFSVKFKNRSVLNFGDLSIISFHATKIFNTFEGGAIVCKDLETKRKIDDLKNFGFHGETEVVLPGINAKMNELQAAMGLLQLRHIDLIIQRRKKITDFYKDKLSSVKGIRFLPDLQDAEPNYAYFPIFIDEIEYGENRDQLYNRLKHHNIHGRRYFFPLISNFNIYTNLPSANKSNLKVANMLSKQVICLPLYPDLDEVSVEEITNLIINRQISDESFKHW